MGPLVFRGARKHSNPKDFVQREVKKKGLTGGDTGKTMQQTGFFGEGSGGNRELVGPSLWRGNPDGGEIKTERVKTEVPEQGMDSLKEGAMEGMRSGEPFRPP